MGAIIRNHEGLILGTMCICRRFRGNALTAKCFGFFYATKFCLESGFVDFILKGNAEHVLNIVKGKELNWSIGGLIAQDAKSLLQNSAKWLVHHVHRGNNTTAHALAKDALVSNVNFLDLEHVPTCIINIVLLDAG